MKIKLPLWWYFIYGVIFSIFILLLPITVLAGTGTLTFSPSTVDDTEDTVSTNTMSSRVAIIFKSDGSQLGYFGDTECTTGTNYSAQYPSTPYCWGTIPYVSNDNSFGTMHIITADPVAGAVAACTTYAACIASAYDMNDQELIISAGSGGGGSSTSTSSTSSPEYVNATSALGALGLFSFISGLGITLWIWTLFLG